MNVQHHPNCSANYPEKVRGEAPQALMEIPIDGDEYVLQCVDCGAYVVISSEGNPVIREVSMAARERETTSRETSRSKRDRDDEDDEPKKGGRGKEEEPQFASLDDDDAIDVGLFSSGPAHIMESLFTEYDYGGTVTRNPPIVWLLTYTRGKGKDKEQYEQPYTLGKGWKIDPKTGKLKGPGGGLPKSCNAIVYLVKPLKRALAKAGIDASVLSAGDPRTLEGMDVTVERIDQVERNIRDKGGDRASSRGRDRDEERGPRTILTITEVESAPWEKAGGGGKRKAKDEDEEDVKPTRKGRGKPEPEEEEETEAGDSTTDDAIEALVAVVEKGKVKIGEPLEEALEKYLKGVKGAADIIDLATSPKFLKSEKGWSYDGKFVDASE